MTARAQMTMPPTAMPATNTLMPPALLRDREAARMCGVSAATWWRWYAAGKTPEAVRVVGVTRWRADELRDWIDGGCPDRAEWEVRRAAGTGR
jgi:predicted DNA-binding transcriptional regulator AlpA